MAAPNPEAGITTNQPIIPFASQCIYANKEDWDLNRSVIEDLYLGQGKKLKEVMRIMASAHLFFATENMFKKHIKKWGLDNKHLKGGEMMIAALKKRSRDAVQKSSKIIIRGKHIPWEDIQRHLSRNPRLQAKLDSTNDILEIGGATLDIIVRTPSPDPRSAFCISRPLNADDDLHFAEELGRIVHNHVMGSLEKGIWILDGDDLHSTLHDLPRDSLLTMSHALYTAHDLLWQGEIQPAFIMIRLFLDFVRDLLPYELPFSLEEMCNLFFYLDHSHTPFREQLSSTLVRHVAELCQVILGIGHPFSLFWSRLQGKTTKECRSAAIVALQPKLGCLAERFGETSAAAVEVEQDLLRKQYFTLGPAIDIRQHQQFLRKLQATQPDRFVCMSLELVDLLVVHGAVDDAEAILQEVIDVVPTQDLDADFHLFWSVHDSLWRVQNASCKDIEARDTGYRLVRECARRSEELDSRAIGSLQFYGRSLRYLGEIELAKEVFDEIKRRTGMIQFVE